MTLLTDEANALSLTIPLVKIDAEKRLVIGRAAQEVRDKTNEILDYETGKPAFQEWSRSFETMSGGLSKGNLRVMHQKTVAGKVVDISYNDEEKAIDVIAKVVDDNEWQKVLSGCYTGFSVGGGYGKKWKDGEMTRYTPVVRELSLVDNPCIPTARFAELVKADGMTEQLPLHGVVRTFSEAWAARPPLPKTFGELFKFDENQHPRGQGGKFSSKGGGGSRGNGVSRTAASVAGATGGAVLGGWAGMHAAKSVGRKAALLPIAGAALGGIVGHSLGDRGAKGKVGDWGLMGAGAGAATGVGAGAWMARRAPLRARLAAMGVGGSLGALFGAAQGAHAAAMDEVADGLGRAVGRWNARRIARNRRKARAAANAPQVSEGRKVVSGHDGIVTD